MAFCSQLPSPILPLKVLRSSTHCALDSTKLQVLQAQHVGVPQASWFNRLSITLESFWGSPCGRMQSPDLLADDRSA